MLLRESIGSPFAVGARRGLFGACVRKKGCLQGKWRARKRFVIYFGDASPRLPRLAAAGKVGRAPASHFLAQNPAPLLTARDSYAKIILHSAERPGRGVRVV